jgi:hypothetical protein
VIDDCVEGLAFVVGANVEDESPNWIGGVVKW